MAAGYQCWFNEEAGQTYYGGDAVAEPVANGYSGINSVSYTHLDVYKRQVQTRTYAERGAQHGRDVYLFQPYYGIDRSFTEQYQKEAQRVAQASEGTYHYYNCLLYTSRCV